MTASALQVIEASLKAFEDIDQYTAIYLKEERINGSKLRPLETILVKFRKPNQIYMKWILEPNKGMELIYPVRDNKVVVEPGGLLDIITPKIYLNPTDKLAMRKNRHPVTEANSGYFIKKYASDFKRALKKREIQVQINENAEVIDQKAIRIEMNFPQDGYYCSRSIVFFDSKTQFPIHAEFYDAKNRLFERVTFTELNLDPNLSDIDFDETNPEYDL